MTCSHRLRTLVVPLAAAFSLLGAAPALAAQRYAAADSTDTNGPCTQAAPCRLDHAVNDAGSGDEVIVAPGDYKVTSALQADVPIDIHGADGQPAPNLDGAASLDAETLALNAGGSASHLNIHGVTTDNATLLLQGATGDDLRVRSANQDAVILKNASGATTILRDSVANSKGNSSAGVVIKGGGPPSAPVSIVNVTAFGDTALLLDASLTSVTVRNSILQGDSKDLDANGGTSADVAFSNFRPDSSSGYVDSGNNQSAAPIFVDDSHHEAAGSPTIDAGTADAPDLGSFDPSGNPRIVGSAPDIGAFEYTGAPDTGDDSGDGTSDGTAAAGGGDGNTILAPPVPPVVGKTVQVSEESGSVLVRLPGTTTFVPLGDAASIPMGSVIDATNGVVSLTSVRDGSGTLQTGQFWGGMFRVFQQKSSHPITELRLVDTGLGKCRSSSSSSKVQAAAGPHGRRYLWGRDRHGRFRTRGRNAVATVRGTVWKTADSCAGTRVTVKKGAVSVKNLTSGKSVLVHAGHSLLARR